MQQDLVINSIKVIKSHSVVGSIIQVLNRRDPSCPRGPSCPEFPLHSIIIYSLSSFSRPTTIFCPHFWIYTSVTKRDVSL